MANTGVVARTFAASPNDDCATLLETRSARASDNGHPNRSSWWQLLEERQDRAPLQLAADDHRAGGINSVNLEHRFGDIETDCRDRLHG
jgi:hypothetical protein